MVTKVWRNGEGGRDYEAMKEYSEGLSLNHLKIVSQSHHMDDWSLHPIALLQKPGNNIYNSSNCCAGEWIPSN